MAELNKKLHLLKPDSTQEAIKLYSTLAEVGDNYLNVKLPAYNEYYKWTPWTQPALTSATSYGTVSAVSGGIDGTHYPYKLFDKGGTSIETKFLSTSSTQSVVLWELPKQIAISKAVITQTSESDWLNRFPKTISIYGSTDNTNYTLLGSVTGYAQPTSGATVTLNCSQIQLCNYIKFVFDLSWGGKIGMQEIALTATYAAISTASDYDYSVEVPATQAYVKLAKPIYYKWTTWAQPVFTTYTASDGSVISASSEGTSWDGHAWRAMDGHTSGGDGNFWGTTGTSTGWWKVVFPYKIAITKLVHYNRDNTSYSSITGQYFADVAMTIPIGSSFINTTSWGTTTVYDSSTPIVTDTIYFNKTAGNNSSGIGELVITAQKAVESTSDDYDYLVNPLNSSSLSINRRKIMMIGNRPRPVFTLYKALTIAKHAYAEVDFTTAGTFTWTAPANVTRIRFAMVGGGAGCWVQGGDNFDTYGYYNPTASSFGNYATSTSQLKDTVNGYALGFNSTVGSGSFGCGGASAGQHQGYTGNTYNGYIDVVAGQTYNIVVGAANQGGTSGFVKIAYGGDI